MRFAGVIAGVAVSALCTVGAPAAHAAQVITGFACGMSATDVPLRSIADPGTVVAELDGGPFAAADPDDPTFVIKVWVACSIQINHPTHAGPDAARAEGWGYGVAYLPPTVVSYWHANADDVYLCTEVRVGTGDGQVSWYLDDSSGEFIEDPSAAWCAMGTGPEFPPQEWYDILCPIAENAPEVYIRRCT